MDEKDLIAVTDKITASDLIMAYENLVFPWPMEGEDLVPWFSPNERGVLKFSNLHLSDSFKKTIKRSPFYVTFCQSFEEVINSCAKVTRKGQDGTWINQEILGSYIELFNMQKAYSVEVWDDKSMQRLVGGLYGVVSKQYISGESMFFLESGASKFALYSLVQKLESLGLSFIDTQMVTPLLKSFGATEVSKNEFRNMVEESTILDSAFYERFQK